MGPSHGERRGDDHYRGYENDSHRWLDSEWLPLGLRRQDSDRIQGEPNGHEVAEEKYERFIHDRAREASIYNKDTDDIIYKQDKRIKELESESNKLKVIIRLRNKVEGLSDILEDVAHWETCPEMYKYRIQKTLGIEVEYDEDTFE